MMHYLALGDSITIDEYPDQEVGTKGNGAASLLHKKLNVLSYYNLSQDGATINNIRDHQMEAAKKLLRGATEEVLITITAGGNDISFGSMKLKAQGKLTQVNFDKMMDSITRNYCDLILEVRQAFPNSHIILNTLYDPTDGTGKLPENCGLWADIAPQYSQGRRQLGQFIAGWGAKLPFVRVADIFKMFDGQGMKINNKYGMYYNPFLIEPGAVGAQSIASLWHHTFLSFCIAILRRELAQAQL